MKIKFLTAVMILAFAGVVRAQPASPSPTPQNGFKNQVFQPSADDPLSSAEPVTNPKSTYDRFTDVTTVWIPYEDLDVSSHHDLAIMAFYTYRGKDADKPEYIGFGFASTPHDLSSRLERRELYVLADGERVSLGRPSARNSKVDFRYVNTITEFLEYKITLQLLKKIAYSRNVAMRLDSFEFDLRQGFLRSMQKLLSGIPNPKPSSAPAVTKRRSVRSKL